MKALRALQGLKASAYGAQGFRFLGHDQGFGGFRGDVGGYRGMYRFLGLRFWF